MPLPTLDDLKTYLGESAARWSDAQLTDVLAVETTAQTEVCRIPTDPYTDIYPVTLGQALMRRVQRNLALRALPLAVLQSDAEGGNTLLPGRDPEVRRLEGPYRKLVVA